MGEPNEATRELLKRFKEAGYELVSIGEPDYDIQDVNISHYKRVKELLKGISISPLQLQENVYFYIEDNSLTPGEYDLTEEDE